MKKNLSLRMRTQYKNYKPTGVKDPIKRKNQQKQEVEKSTFQEVIKKKNPRYDYYFKT